MFAGERGDGSSDLEERGSARWKFPKGGDLDPSNGESIPGKSGGGENARDEGGLGETGREKGEGKEDGIGVGRKWLKLMSVDLAEEVPRQRDPAPPGGGFIRRRNSRSIAA